jgi:hypothetical protein
MLKGGVRRWRRGVRDFSARAPAGAGAPPAAVAASGRGPGLRGGGPPGSRDAGAGQPDHEPVVPGAGHSGDDPVPARAERGGDPVVLHELLPIAAAADWAKQRRLWRRLGRTPRVKRPVSHNVRRMSGVTLGLPLVLKGAAVSPTSAHAATGRPETTHSPNGARPLWVPKTSSADRIDAKMAGERRLAERRRTRPGREFSLVPMERAIRIRSSLSRSDAPYHRRDDSPCDGRERGYAARV